MSFGRHSVVITYMTVQTEMSPPAGYSPEEEKPLGSYAALMAGFSALAGAFSLWFRASDRELPERPDGRDLVLLTLASHKASRMIAKDRVTRRPYGAPGRRSP